MKILPITSGLALLIFGVTAGAHSHATKTVPAEGSVITASPPNIVLNFSDPARLTALSIQKGNDEPQKLGPLPTEAAKQISVPAPQLAPGSYVVNWRIVSGDNHVMSGKISFTYSTEKPTDHSAHH